MRSLLKGGGRLGEILQGKEISLGEGKVAPLHALLISLPFLQCGLTSLTVQKAALDTLTPIETFYHRTRRHSTLAYRSPVIYELVMC